METIERRLDEVLNAVNGMRSEVADVKADVAETREIVKAWEAVKTGTKFVKWLGALAAAVAAIALAAKAGWHMLFK